MTKPTRAQERACDRLAEAILIVTEAARIDGGQRLNTTDLFDLAARIARISSAFPPDQVLARALDQRARGLKLPQGTSELLMLIEGGPAPLEALLLDDDGFRARVEAADKELGGLD